MKYNISNLDKFTKEIKPIDFSKYSMSHVAEYKVNLIDRRVNELIAPYVRKEFQVPDNQNFRVWDFESIIKCLTIDGYKFGYIDDSSKNYRTYYIEDIKTQAKDEFIVKNEMDIKNTNYYGYKATIYISDIVRNIKQR